MSTYMIHRLRPCQTCQCTGYIEHPAWNELYATQAGAQGMSYEQIVAWFMEKGWCDSYENAPAEEVKCWECAGQGYIHGDVDAQNFIQDHDLMTRADVETMLEALAATFRRTIAEITA